MFQGMEILMDIVFFSFCFDDGCGDIGTVIADSFLPFLIQRQLFKGIRIHVSTVGQFQCRNAGQCDQ